MEDDLRKYTIDVTKIEKHRLFAGKPKDDGTIPRYLNFTALTNKDGGVDKHGYHGFLVQDVTKEERLDGVKGPIIGNWKRLSRGDSKPYANSPAPAPAPAPARVEARKDDDIPW